MSHEQFETLATGYALDALDGDDLRGFREHLAGGCPACEALLGDAREALAALALQAPPVSPPAPLRSALLARIAAGADRPVPAGARPWIRWVPWAMAAAVVAALLVGLLVAGRYEAEIGDLRRQMAALQERVQRDEAALREQVAGSARLLDLLADPGTRVIALHDQGPAPRASGRVVWSDAAGGHLFVADLPPAPPGRTYEVWTITGGAPRPAGLLDVGASGHAGRAIDPVGDGGRVDVFAITLEPAGGVPAPTGPIVLASR